MRRSKICILTAVHRHDDVRIFHKEGATLAAAGYEVHVVAPGAPHGEKDGVIFHRVGPPAGRLRRMALTTLAVLREGLSTGAEIFHFHDPELIPAALFLRAAGKTVLYDVHEDFPRDILVKGWIPGHARPAVSAAFEMFENAAGRRMSAVVAATTTIAERFRRLGCRTVAVCNYALKEELSSPAAACRHRQKAVCFLGGITRRRGIMEMVEAIGRCDGKLLLAGWLQENGTAEEARRAPGWKNVEWLGALSRPAMRDVLAGSMAGLVLFHPGPNHSDSRPNKIFEYLSAGLPVIISDFPEWKELVEEHRCGICVDPLDPGAIASAITWVFEHPAEAAQMGARGREAVEKLYNWEREGEKLLLLYEELLSCA